MSLPSTPVLIASAFGRGHALAIELAQNEIPVTLIDVSNYLGEVASEDDEGPFGFFSQGLLITESQRLLEDHAPLLQVNGFTWMLPDGPFELRSSLCQKQKESLDIPDQVWTWVTESAPTTAKDLQYLLNGDFDETWLYHLSRSFHSNFWAPNYRAGLVEGWLPFQGDFLIRSMARVGMQKSFEALERAGVKVRTGAHVVDASRGQSGHLRGLEVRFNDSDTGEMLEAEQFVWLMSGEETEKLAPALAEKLFPGGIVRPKGTWTRARLKLPNIPQRESLPLHSVWVKDRSLPWTHENLFVLIRTADPERFDIWFRIPEIYRFQKDYTLRHVELIRQHLEERLCSTGFQVIDLPVTVTKSAQQIGPSRHPLFDENDIAEMKLPNWKNFHWVGIEVCPGVGWNYMFMKSRETGERVKAWWKVREEERIKNEMRNKKRAEVGTDL